MLAFISAVVLALLMLLTIALNKTYHYVTRKEVQRQARLGDKQAKRLYKPLSYGVSLRILLWSVIVLSAAGSFVLFMTAVPASIAFVLIVLILAMGFWWLPASPVTSFGGRLAIWFAPLVSWVLYRLYPVLRRLERLFRSHYPVHVHSGLYEKEDILELLERQKHQADNRIPDSEIDIAQHALQFGDRSVHEVMIPRRVVRLVRVGDTIGPVLIDDLHKSGHSRYPVYEGKRDHIVGVLFLHDLVDLKHGGTVANVMHHKVSYVHEDFSLYRVFEAFLRTKQQLFIVVNSFEEFVGIISIEDILEQIIGKPMLDEFDGYDNLRAVATSLAAKEHEEHEEQHEEPVAEPDAPPQEQE